MCFLLSSCLLSLPVVYGLLLKLNILFVKGAYISEKAFIKLLTFKKGYLFEGGIQKKCCGIYFKICCIKEFYMNLLCLELELPAHQNFVIIKKTFLSKILSYHHLFDHLVVSLQHYCHFVHFLKRY